MVKRDLSEADYLKQYDPKRYATPLASVDNVIFCIDEDRLQVLLVKRAEHPCKARWSIPGGFIDLQRDASLEGCALRTLQAKTGVDSPYLEQLATVGNATRDPRGWSMTCVYFALIPRVAPLPQNDKVGSVAWVPVDDLPAGMAFDHAELIQMALTRLRAKATYSILPVHLLHNPFTLTEFQRANEIVLGRTLEKKSFRRRLLAADVLEEIGERREGMGRPAALYQIKAGYEGFVFGG